MRHIGLWKRLRFFMFVFAVLGVVAINGNAAADTFPLRLIHVNDTHSHFEETEIKINIGGKGTYTEVGGYARLAQAAEKWRAEKPNSLLLHAGDAVQGTLYFTKYKGEADMALLNLMKFDAMALGNHEFDKGPDTLTSILKQARFPVLAANLDTSKNTDLTGLVKPYVVMDVGGKKVGIIGLVTDETPIISSPGDNLAFIDPIEAAQKAVKELEGQGVNMIVALTHMGILKDLELAQKVAGLDVVVGGHSHTLMGDYAGIGMKPDLPYPYEVKGPSGPVYVVTSWEWAKAVGALDLEFDEGGKVVKTDGMSRLIVGDRFRRKNEEGKKIVQEGEAKAEIMKQVDASPYLVHMAANAAAMEKIDQYKSGIDALRKQVVAKIVSGLLHVREPGVHKATSKDLPKGSLVAPIVSEGILWKLDDVGQNVDVALQNAGGVRIDLPQGDLTVARVYELLPFGNTMVVLEVSGDVLKRALEHGVTKSSGAFPYVGGARYSADMSKPEGNRIVSLEIRNAKGEWEPVIVNKNYRVATNNFMAGGGDGYGMLKAVTGYRYDTGYVDAEIFMEYAQKLKTLSPPQDTGITYKK